MWDTAAYERLAASAVAAVARYVEESQSAGVPIVSPPPLPELIDRLELRALAREGGLDGERFEPWLRRVLENTTRLHHPAEIAHQVGAPDVPAAVADLVHGVVNSPMSIYEMGPAAHAMERVVVEWMIEKVGWGEEAGGVLTHGGSLANLTALLAARAAAAPDAWTEGVDGTLAVLAPPGSHYSVKRSAAMLGLGERAVIDLKVDDCERIEPGALGESLERARAAGRRPMALVAAACATSTGLHDDLEAVGSFCREHGIWFHVDAAHGGPALLSAAAQALPARDRARGLGHLGRAQDDANVGARGGRARTRGAASRGGLQAEGRLPDLRGRRRSWAEPARAAGGVHQGADRHADLHEPGLSR